MMPFGWRWWHTVAVVFALFQIIQWCGGVCS